MCDPNVPESLEGWWILHRMFAFDRRAGIRRRRSGARNTPVTPPTWSFTSKAATTATWGSRRSSVTKAISWSLITLALSMGSRTLRRSSTSWSCGSFFAPRGSYVSVLEVGLYDATGKIHAELNQRGLAPQSPEWIAGFDELVRKQAESPYIEPRLWASNSVAALSLLLSDEQAPRRGAKLVHPWL